MSAEHTVIKLDSYKLRQCKLSEVWLYGIENFALQFLMYNSCFCCELELCIFAVTIMSRHLHRIASLQGYSTVLEVPSVLL